MVAVHQVGTAHTKEPAHIGHAQGQLIGINRLTIGQYHGGRAFVESGRTCDLQDTRDVEFGIGRHTNELAIDSTKAHGAGRTCAGDHIETIGREIHHTMADGIAQVHGHAGIADFGRDRGQAHQAGRTRGGFQSQTCGQGLGSRLHGRGEQTFAGGGSGQLSAIGVERHSTPVKTG